ncbi:Short-chain dehydrogenase [Arboricoccus pini]|uniref:Short-chain dehydrogenase n=1 Tax=Arboricoccus pini TaxID=1963835 RepID=A0A212QWW7_9PROT|nr:SDR family NAD(P)-dependent oxidoreductase [Arboricoccus pini]SNB64248.1 Short-chain dehydrogenase [Arboricoccus pini]
MIKLTGRTVLVTGASRGLGRAVALACAGGGASLVLVARTRGALEELDDEVRGMGAPPPILITLDLLNGDLVDKLGPALFERCPRLDGLFSAAADLGVLTPVAQLDPVVFARTVGLDLLAQQRLIRTLDPLLRASDAGRAVFATCEAARTPRAYWGGYAAAKAALEALVLAYAAEQGLTRLKVNLVDPGPMDTRLRGRAFPGERAGDRPDPSVHAAAIAELLAPSSTAHGRLISLCS